MLFTPRRSGNQPFQIFLGITAIALYAVLMSPSAHAYLVSASTNWSIGTGVGDYMMYSGVITPNIVCGSGITPVLTTASTVTED